MDNQYLGQLLLFAGNYAPYGWLQCNGQLLQVSRYSALFSLLGNTYGGDGRTTFALPDLRGRIPSHYGNGPGLTPTVLGETQGTQAYKLTLDQLPMHTHEAVGAVSIGCNSTNKSDSPDPSGAYFKQTTGVNSYAGSSNAVMGASNSTVTVGNAGNFEPMNNQQPSLGMTYIIAMSGDFPQRP